MQLNLAKVKTISKGELCRVFGLFSQRTGRCYYSRLRKRFFTDEALKNMGISAEEYRVPTFSFEHTQIIIEYFKIEAHEIEDPFY